MRTHESCLMNETRDCNVTTYVSTPNKLKTTLDKIPTIHEARMNTTIVMVKPHEYHFSYDKSNIEIKRQISSSKTEHQINTWLYHNLLNNAYAEITKHP